VSRSVAERKVKLLVETYATQGSKDWFDAETLYAVMRLRGVESRAPERYAEAFHARKLVIDI
jgi:hypothetical protein